MICAVNLILGHAGFLRNLPDRISGGHPGTDPFVNLIGDLRHIQSRLAFLSAALHNEDHFAFQTGRRRFQLA